MLTSALLKRPLDPERILTTRRYIDGQLAAVNGKPVPREPDPYDPAEFDSLREDFAEMQRIVAHLSARLTAAEVKFEGKPKQRPPDKYRLAEFAVNEKRRYEPSAYGVNYETLRSRIEGAAENQRSRYGLYFKIAKDGDGLLVRRLA